MRLRDMEWLRSTPSLRTNFMSLGPRPMSADATAAKSSATPSSAAFSATPASLCSNRLDRPSTSSAE